MRKRSSKTEQRWVEIPTIGKETHIILKTFMQHVGEPDDVSWPVGQLGLVSISL
jgi:hypothetical protein